MPVYHYLGVWKHGSALIVRFGEHRILDDITVEKIGVELYGVADRADCQHLILNLSGVVRLSSVMLGKLLMLQRKMAIKGGKLKLCEIEPEAQEVFASTKLSHILDIRESEADALNALACP
jgi:anti-anti-sigma factor